MMQSNSLAELHILPVLVVKILNKGGTKRQVAWDDLNSTMHQSRKVYFNSYIMDPVPNLQMMQSNVVLEQHLLPVFGYEQSE